MNDNIVVRSPSTDNLLNMRREFLSSGVTNITKIVSADLMHDILMEVEKLLPRYGVRRDIKKVRSTGNTPRRMTNIDYKSVAKNSELIMSTYACSTLREQLEVIVGETIYDCPYDREKIVATHLHRLGDTHGWHWDDYSLAVVWVLKAPPKEAGGVVQYIAHTEWKKETPEIISHFVTAPIYTMYLPSGSMYLMQTATTLHRVYPIIKGGCERTILNFAYALKSDMERNISHETVENLWSK